MDKELKLKLLELRRQSNAFRQRQCAAYDQSQARIQAYYSVPPRFRPLPAPERYEWQSWPEHLRSIPCGATTRAGTPCKLTTIYSSGRCKLHGGKSTGAKTKAGRKRQRDGYRAWLEKQRASKAGRKRTRTYTSEVIGIGRGTLSEISASAPESELQAVNGIGVRSTGDSLITTLPGGHSVTVSLTTTRPKYGGVRWWYVCPVCKTRKGALYVSDSALQCRQCAGIHYASQSRPRAK